MFLIFDGELRFKQFWLDKIQQQLALQRGKNSGIFVCITALSINISFLNFIIFDIFQIMQNLKLKISAQHYQRHKEALRNLMIQNATSALCFLPVILNIIGFALDFEYVQLLTNVCLVWFASHSSLNMVSLIIFFAPFREYVTRHLPE